MLNPNDQYTISTVKCESLLVLSTKQLKEYMLHLLQTCAFTSYSINGTYLEPISIIF